MEIELLQLQCEKNVLNKLEGEDYIRFALYDNGYILPNSDISSPIIRIVNVNEENTQQLLINCNYAKIKDLERFYFIEKIVAVSDDVLELYLRVDVLESFKNDILTANAYVTRNEYDYDNKIVDNEVINISGVRTTKIELDNDLFNTEVAVNEDALKKYILTIMTTEVSE